MKRFSFQIGAEFKATKAQLWSAPAIQVWEAISLRERESLKRKAPAFGRACAACLARLPIEQLPYRPS